MPAEPKTLDIRHDNPARVFMVSNEVQIIAVLGVVYRGGGWWRAGYTEDIPKDAPHYTTRSLSGAQKWCASTMEELADKARADCAETCGTDGTDTDRRPGDFACGVTSPHGISTTITDGDGNDVTDDYRLNRM